MFKSTWTYIALGFIVAAAGGAAYYYITHATIEKQAPPSAAVPPSVAPAVPQDDDVKRKTLEGIGSIKNLKPVPLQPSPQR
ncbi:hypothetical protein WDL1P3_00187 (plasmid) [Variovorax sp. WDL1]|uniref:hypothetical protein n=1 Tax=Variovorax sp. WDL1 TaxID=207745 RepID=UPI000A51BDB5|nr:hypothetical protein [Variovorax sp. WDL1]PNG46136.1 hypothetical protein CHC06_08114 [Variovorax sp. B2]PNG46205.1 hypothetical protein CHC07_07953 [Variovorax sp. B4]VTV19260.1 hypothetical protein WDL1P3_00187 [Variovorax sp. WDL1]